MKKTVLESCVVSILLVCIFFLGFSVKDNPDTFYHIKAGEIFLSQGLVYRDIFSFSAQGRAWAPYEWLFEIGIATLVRFFGLSSIPVALGVCMGGAGILIYIFCRRFFTLPIWKSLLVCFFYFAYTMDFYVARPQTLMSIFFLSSIMLILLYMQKNKNYLWLFIPIVFAWGNMHSSVIFAPYLLGSFGILSFCVYLCQRDRALLDKTKVLLFWSIVALGESLLPPVGLIQYKLLWLFTLDHQQISSFFTEWALPQNDIQIFSIYTIVTTCIVAFTLLISYKRKKFPLWTIPLFVFLFLAYSAERNMFYAYPVLAILLAYCLSYLKIPTTKKKKTFLVLLILLLLAMHSWWMYQKRFTQLFYPVEAATFIDNNLHGHMLNEFNDGSYLIYRLYPRKKVFIDLRADVYLCCEMPAYTKLHTVPTVSEINQFMNTYAISFVLIGTRRIDFIDHIAPLLAKNPQWVLVYWDDGDEIFVKKDGKNDLIISRMGSYAATPYGAVPWKGNIDQAFLEYSRMIGIVDSAKSRNALGLILLKKGNINQAKAEFEKAISLRSDFVPPYLNLATLAIQAHDYLRAVGYYESVKKLDASSADPYIYEGEIYEAVYHDHGKAQQIWQEGLTRVTDKRSLQKLQELLSSE